MKNKPVQNKPFARPVTLWVLVALVLLSVFVLFRIFRPGVNQDVTLSPAITVAEAVELREDGAFVLDVRTLEEWNEFHVPDSTHIPLDALAGRVNEVPKDQPVVVVCRSGNRSQSGRDILLKAGYTEVTSMNGGLTEWRSQGYPIVTGP